MGQGLREGSHFRQAYRARGSDSGSAGPPESSEACRPAASAGPCFQRRLYRHAIHGLGLTQGDLLADDLVGRACASFRVPDPPRLEVLALGRNRPPRSQTIQHPCEHGLHLADRGPRPRSWARVRGGKTHRLRRDPVVSGSGTDSSPIALLRGCGPLVCRVHPGRVALSQASLPWDESHRHAAPLRTHPRLRPGAGPRVDSRRGPSARGRVAFRGDSGAPGWGVATARRTLVGAPSQENGRVPGLREGSAHVRSEPADIGVGGTRPRVRRAPQ
mmetsp:Transcript_108306/g.305343  ORF Transcript_108306/g.305343 Transcript_108306/m.305343 type:complete len:273 (-) Transcript_108306:329-1147(-)